MDTINHGERVVFCKSAARNAASFAPVFTVIVYDSVPTSTTASYQKLDGVGLDASFCGMDSPTVVLTHFAVAPDEFDFVTAVLAADAAGTNNTLYAAFDIKIENMLQSMLASGTPDGTVDIGTEVSLSFTKALPKQRA